MAIDITNTDIKVNDLVYLDVNPLHIDSNIRREYVWWNKRKHRFLLELKIL